MFGEPTSITKSYNMDKDLGFGLFDDVEGDLQLHPHWNVDSEGNMQYLGHTKTKIIKEELTVGNLLTHFLSKVLDEGAPQEFYFAFIQALKNAGYTSMEIDLTDIHKSIKVK